MGREKPHVVPKYIIFGSFIVGMVSSVCFRLIIIAQHLSPWLVRPLWYVAVVGNFIFFYYRYRITRKRKKAVEDFSLVEKISSGEACLSEEDREVMGYLLSSIKLSRENMNYLIIFLFSLGAIAADLLLIVILK